MPIAYHITPAANVASILDQGLLPSLGERSKEMKEPTPAVFAYPTHNDCAEGLCNWLGDWYSDQENELGCDIPLVVIAFETEGLTRIPQAEHGCFELTFTDIVRPDAIRIIYAEKDFEYQDESALV